LREHKLYANLNKCGFFQSHIHYLGHIVFEEGISVNPKKIKAIREWPTLKSADDIRSFMRLEGYYGRYIWNLSKIGHSITTLQRKGKKIEWNA